MVKEEQVIKKKRKNTKVIVGILCVVILCVVSFFILASLNNDKKNNKPSILTIYEYRDEEDEENSGYYSIEEQKNKKIFNKYTYSCLSNNCSFLSDGQKAYNNIIIGDNGEVYVYNVLTKEKVKTLITYKKIDDYYQYIINDKEFNTVKLLDDILDNRLWLFGDFDQMIYDYQENKVFKEFHSDSPIYYVPIKTKSSYLYILYDEGEGTSHYGVIYTKNFEKIIELKDFYEIDGIVEDNLYIHTTYNKNNSSKIKLYRIGTDGTSEIIKEFGNKNIISINFINYNYVIADNDRIILKDKNDKELKLIGIIPKPKNDLGYEYVTKNGAFGQNEKDEDVVIIYVCCENGFETEYYCKKITYNITKDIIEEKDYNKISN